MADRTSEIRARLAKASPWPWRSMEFLVTTTGADGCFGSAVADLDHCDNRCANTIFIEHAPADVAFLLEEVARLKRGDWTPEEVHALCHNLPAVVGAAAFAAGCSAAQRKLYGIAPDADEVARLRKGGGGAA